MNSVKNFLFLFSTIPVQFPGNSVIRKMLKKLLGIKPHRPMYGMGSIFFFFLWNHFDRPICSLGFSFQYDKFKQFLWQASVVDG